jgi:enterobactin synthetase component D
MARWGCMTPDVAFDLTLEHGRCIGLRIPEAEADLAALAALALAPSEQARASGFPLPRRRTWVGGRAALRETGSRAGLTLGSVGTDDRGAPVLPPGVAASVTHKEKLAAALVAFETRARVGVDLEIDIARAQDIGRRVLTAGELAEIAHLEGPERAREVLLRFSAKEAIYKALDPFVRRYVGFEEMAVSPREDGTALVTPLLKAGEGPFVIEARWLRFDGIVLTTARVERAPGQPGP